MKKMFMAAALVAALGAGTVFGYRSFKPAQHVSDLQLTNAIALTSDENPCNEVFPAGYREWDLSGFLRVKKGFRDCCGVLQEGYNPQGNCPQ